MVNGIINVYKEKGYTSFDVVARLRGIYHQKKIGHTGTLDPDAEGVLPVCLGKATKVCDLLTDKDKVYRAVLLLGQATDTQDISGQITDRAAVNVSEEEVTEVIKSFIGDIKQIPPMYSALKVNGQKLCDLARKGITIERKARDIKIYDIDIEEINLPEVTLRVHCSKGTYIRTLCHDIGMKLGCYGCMKSLIRTRVSVFDISQARKLSEIENAPENGIISVDSLFMDKMEVLAAPEADKLVSNGNRIPLGLTDGTGLKDKEQIRLYTSCHVFVGLYEYHDQCSDLKPVKIFME